MNLKKESGPQISQIGADESGYPHNLRNLRNLRIEPRFF
jgi:hypothetical protein